MPHDREKATPAPIEAGEFVLKSEYPAVPLFLDAGEGGEADDKTDDKNDHGGDGGAVLRAEQPDNAADERRGGNDEQSFAECLAVADTVGHVFAVIAVYQLGAPAVYQNAENDENRRDNKHQNRIGQHDFYLLDDAMCR